MKAPSFDHERLDVYRAELEFIAWLAPILQTASASAAGRTREI
jgi:hypothetical protein